MKESAYLMGFSPSAENTVLAIFFNLDQAIEPYYAPLKRQTPSGKEWVSSG